MYGNPAPDAFAKGAGLTSDCLYLLPCTTCYVTPIGAHYTNQVCTQQAVEVTDMFLFKVIYNEDYKFYFWEGSDEDGNPQYIEKEVVVDSD